MRQVSVISALIIIVFALACSNNGHDPYKSTLDRDADPVVLTGADLYKFNGTSPYYIVAFKYTSKWIQIPVQVDERKIADFYDIYNHPTGSASGLSFPLTTPGYTGTFYADSGTLTGADSDPKFDDNDELVFMARDAGGKPSNLNEPSGVVSGSGIELLINDPLDSSVCGYVYLFISDGSLTPSAGVSCGTYSFSLTAGSYPDNYQFNLGPNPEDTWFVSRYYERHFSDRWLTDDLRIKKGSSSGVNFIEMHNNQFGPTTGGRTVDTFDGGEGAFVANISGAVRSIRSYIGANSGPLTQRESIFYEMREDVHTYLRVHAIPGMMDFYDYKTGVTGMVYSNSLNPGGVAIDGIPEIPVSGLFSWEMVSGPAGSFIRIPSIQTTITSLTGTNYYLDDSTPGVTQYTGDTAAWGVSGTYITSAIPVTDPRTSGYETLHASTILYYEAPGMTSIDAERYKRQANNPLTVMVTDL